MNIRRIVLTTDFSEAARQAYPVAVDLARSLVAEGAGKSEAAREAAHRTGARRREIYDRMLSDSPES